MSYPQNWTPASGSRSHTYEQIQPNQENYMEMHRHPVPISSGQVMESQTRGKFTAQKAVVLLGLLCALLLIICIVLGSTRYSSPSSSEKAVETIQNQWLYFDKSMYLISRELKTWDESKHICENFKANLVTIENPKESKFVEQLASIMKQNSWIGLTDRASEGVWEWIDYSPFRTGHWSEGQPKTDDGTEDCVSVHSGGWHANPCHKRLHYICKIKMSCLPTTCTTYQRDLCACLPSLTI